MARAPGPEDAPEAPGRLHTPQGARLLLRILTKIKNCIDRHKQTRPTPTPSINSLCARSHCAP